MDAALIAFVYWMALTFFLVWLFGRLAQRRAPIQFGGVSCPSCSGRFTPLKLKWEKTSKCLNGLDYCDPCKKKGECGCVL